MFWLLLAVIILGFLAVCYVIAAIGNDIRFELRLMHSVLDDIRNHTEEKIERDEDLDQLPRINE